MNSKVNCTKQSSLLLQVTSDLIQLQSNPDSVSVSSLSFCKLRKGSSENQAEIWLGQCHQLCSPPKGMEPPGAPAAGKAGHRPGDYCHFCQLRAVGNPNFPLEQQVPSVNSKAEEKNPPSSTQEGEGGGNSLGAVLT